MSRIGSSYLTITTIDIHDNALTVLLCSAVSGSNVAPLLRRQLRENRIVGLFMNSANKSEVAVVLVPRDQEFNTASVDPSTVSDAIEAPAQRSFKTNKSWESIATHITARGEDLVIEILSTFSANATVIRFFRTLRTRLAEVGARWDQQCIAPRNASTKTVEVCAA